MQLIGLVLEIFAACPPPQKIQRTEINLKKLSKNFIKIIA